MKLKIILMSAAVAVALGAAGAASASTVWTDWTSSTSDNTNGSAAGTMGSVGVSYTGELQRLDVGYPSYTPTGSYVGGIVTDIPGTQANTDDLLVLVGDTGATNTITFSHAVTNPIVAIWSLGQGGINAQFDFDQTPTLQAGGPSAEYNGQSITIGGNDVFGSEGNGTIAFLGTFTSLTFTNPVYENYYGFTVGYNQGVPEPASWAMMLVGFGGIGGAMRIARRKNAAALAA